MTGPGSESWGHRTYLSSVKEFAGMALNHPKKQERKMNKYNLPALLKITIGIIDTKYSSQCRDRVSS
jgi:hypothetical protein